MNNAPSLMDVTRNYAICKAMRVKAEREISEAKDKIADLESRLPIMREREAEARAELEGKINEA